MKKKRNIKLTNDPMTNIKIMLPMLNEEQRRAMSHIMFGCFIGEEISKNRNVLRGVLSSQRENLNKQELQQVNTQ